jgi:hypothetical protein
MAHVFDSQLFGYLGQLWSDVDIYPSIFGSAKPKIAGESKYLNAPDAGISFALTKKLKVESIFLYAEGIENFSQYDDALPGGLSFAQSRKKVRKALGDPVFSGEVGGIGLMAIDFSFDRFESETHYLRVTYVENDASIRLITLGMA